MKCPLCPEKFAKRPDMNIKIEKLNTLNIIREQEEQKIQTPLENQQLNCVSELILNCDT